MYEKSKDKRLRKKAMMKSLKHYCTASISNIMENSGGIISGEKGKQYCYKNNGADILVVAHCDTVQQDNIFSYSHVKKSSKNYIFSSKLDDRVGVFTMLYVLPILGVRFDFLLTENEETGATTAADFAFDYIAQEKSKRKQYNWVVEFDRAGEDVVTYSYNFRKPLDKYFPKIGWGSFTDICALEELGCKAFNIGVGYENCHSINAYMDYDVYIRQLNRFIHFYNERKDEYFPHTVETTKVYKSSADHSQMLDSLYEEDEYSNSYYNNHYNSTVMLKRKSIHQAEPFYWCSKCACPKSLSDSYLAVEVSQVPLRKCITCQTVVHFHKYGTLAQVWKGVKKNVGDEKKEFDILENVIKNTQILEKNTPVKLLKPMYYIHNKRSTHNKLLDKVKMYQVGSKGIVSTTPSSTSSDKVAVRFKNGIRVYIDRNLVATHAVYKDAILNNNKYVKVTYVPFVFPTRFEEEVIEKDVKEKGKKSVWYKTQLTA